MDVRRRRAPGSGLSGDVIFEMYWLIILTAILFVIGVVTYSRTRLSAAG